MALELPSINNAIVYTNPGTMDTSVVKLRIPVPGPGQVLVRILYAGVCHTDYCMAMNMWKPVYNLPNGHVGGHEAVGEVVAHGEHVFVPPLGSKVGVKFCAGACLNCSNCLQGIESQCPTVRISGISAPGTFQQYCVSQANYLTPIPPTISGEELGSLAPLMCGGITVYAALRRAGARAGDWVAISGSGGGLGHLAIQFAKALGCKVIAIDARHKRQFCLELGADHFVDYGSFENDTDMCKFVAEKTSGGPKIALVCSSSNRSYAQALGFMTVRGIVVCIGAPEDAITPIEMATAASLINRELTIMGVRVGSRQDAVECLDFAARGLVRTRYHLRKMSELSEVFLEMQEAQILGRVVIDLRTP